MNRDIIYLAGKMSGLSVEEMCRWRNEFKLKFKNHCKQEGIHNPFNIVSPTDFYSFEEKKHKTEKEVMDYDLWLIKNSTLIVVNLDYPNSLGTAIELYEGNKHCGIPVIGFGTTENHPWIEECVSVKFNTMNEVINYIFEFYIPHIVGNY
jgi:hypothetical protein